MTTKIVKPWGFELKLTENDLPYTGKILFVEAGKRLSLQYHDQKTETLTLLSGQAELTIGPDKDRLQTNPMIQNEGVTINPATVHRIKAIKDSILIEVSTPEIGNTIRLDDDYSRPTETEEIRSTPNRGWSNT